jgi:uncharacterized protein (TIGR03083 family)
MARSVADAAAHIVIAQRRFADLAQGAPFPLDDVDRQSVAANNAALIDAFDETDPARLAAQLVESTEQFCEFAGKLAATDTVDFLNHQPLPIPALMCISLGEHVLHGYDMAAGLNAAWRIDPGAAALVLAGYAPLLPGSVDPVATAGLTASIDIRLTGGAAFRAAFTDGVLTLAEPDEHPTDAILVTDASTMVLAATGRLRLPAAVALGLAEVSGDDPSLAVRFPDLFVHL